MTALDSKSKGTPPQVQKDRSLFRCDAKCNADCRMMIADLAVWSASDGVTALGRAERGAIVQAGIHRMYGGGPPEETDVLYYVTLYKENYDMPPMPDTPGLAERIG